ncbi:hypothetical protein [Bifidobacterium longum]|uniref:hypothetical protein n=1 Tax=Bifidobacterium longum TaxID=216816 RepID=UPI002649538E|nr:hypothetical protein [Bifidobacterium longum]
MAFGSEVGTGHVSIFPSMKGFRSAVDKEMRGAGKSGSNRFSQAFGNGSKIGKSFGGSFKKAFGSSARGVADDVLKPLKRDAAQASSKASAALLNYRQATVNVQQAQERLNSAIARYGSDSTQAQTASINLEKSPVASGHRSRQVQRRRRTARGREEGAQGRRGRTRQGHQHRIRFHEDDGKLVLGWILEHQPGPIHLHRTLWSARQPRA